VNRPPAVLVDVDGTLVDVSSVRHHVAGKKRNFELFHRESAHCPPHDMALRWVEEKYDTGHHILVVTARVGKWRDLTHGWLDRHLTRPHTELVMRADGDFRPDYEVKRDIHAVLAARYDIKAAIDDNVAVVQLWEVLGIPVTVVPGWPG